MTQGPDPVGEHIGDGTRTVHAGLPAAAAGAPLGTSPVLASTYHLAGEPTGPYQYGRYTNPSWSGLEQALAELEGAQLEGAQLEGVRAEAVLFPSGMAAVSAVLLTVLRPGSVLVLPSDGYYTLRRLADGLLSELGVEVRTVPTAGAGHAEALAGATLLWLETPTNPGLDVCDVAALAGAAHAAGALVAVDNTTCTPLAQQPLLLGADYSVASDTKALTGHSDLLLGHVATRDPARAEALRSWRTLTGAVAGPFEAWLAHRSLATLDLRLARQAANGLALAERLVAHPAVADVRHPWRPGDPSYALTRQQTRRGIGLVSFTLADAAAADRFLGALRLVAETTSFGGVHSSAERRARWRGDEVAEGLVRFSCGCEDTVDLLADVEQALERSAL